MAPHLDPRGILRFQRYDLPLETGDLVVKKFHVDATQKQLLALHAIDEPANIDRLYELASDVARRQVSVQDFVGCV